MSVPLERGLIGELFWSTSDGVALVRSGRVIAWNPAAERLFGVSAAEATAESFDLTGLLGGAPLPPGEPARIDAPGTAHRVVEATVYPVDASDVVALLFRDLTVQVRYERGLRQIAEFARDVLITRPATPVLFQTVATLAKRLTDASYAAVLDTTDAGSSELRHFAYDAPREEFPERLPRAVGMLGLAIESGNPLRVDDIRGHPHSIGLPEHHPPLGALLAAPLASGPGVIGEIVVANHVDRPPFSAIDETLITDLARHASVAIEWATRRDAAEAEEQRRRDVANAARHDIANPLSVAMGYLRMLERRYDEMTQDQRQSAFTASRDALARVEQFARRLLYDEQLHDVSDEPQWETIVVRDMLDDVRRDSAVEIEHDVAVDATALDDCPPTFDADPAMVRQVLDNLVGNAVKHSPPGATVEVTARAEPGGGVRFDVTDNGPGIPADEHAIIFERYGRSQWSRRAKVPGTGLGLAIVRQIVRAHGGSVGVSSRVGEGSTFWATFPAERPAARPRYDGSE